MTREPLSARPRRLAWFCCRLGLHFMSWDYMRDGFRCECQRQFLWAESIRNLAEVRR